MEIPRKGEYIRTTLVFRILLSCLAISAGISLLLSAIAMMVFTVFDFSTVTTQYFPFPASSFGTIIAGALILGSIPAYFPFALLVVTRSPLAGALAVRILTMSIAFGLGWFYFTNAMEDRGLLSAAQASVAPWILLFPGSAYISARAFESRRREQLVGLARWTLLSTASLTITAAVYYFVISRVWFRSTDLQRGLIRIVAHPFIWEATSFFSRSLVKKSRWGEDASQLSRAPILVGLVLLLSGLWGRVLTSGSGSLAVTIIVSLVIGVLEVTLRLSSGQRDRMFLRLLKGKEEAEILHAASADTRASWVILDLILEGICVISASFVQYLYSITPTGEPVPLERLALNILSQLAIELVVGFFCLSVEARHGLPVARAWSQRFGGGVKDKREYVLSIAVISVMAFTFFISNIASTKGGFVIMRENKE